MQLETRLKDDLGLAGRPTSALTDRYETESELVDALRSDVDLSEIRGVGTQSANSVWAWFKDEYPDANRARLENSRDYCTEFTTDHELPDGSLEDGQTYFAFVCPRCDHANPLEGDPKGFADRPFRCENCNWVPLLEGESLRGFAENELVDDETEVPA